MKKNILVVEVNVNLLKEFEVENLDFNMLNVSYQMIKFKTIPLKLENFTLHTHVPSKVHTL